MHFSDTINIVNTDILIRILISLALGFAIGVERELTSKWAGLRTHILVCLGSTVFTILSIYAFPTMITHTSPSGFGDPARIAAQILTGIGFIGGGTVLRHGPSVYGLTTAATLWIVSAIGMAVGAGAYELATIATLITVLVLTGIRTLENTIIKRHQKRFSKIKAVIICPTVHLEDITSKVSKHFSHIFSINKKSSEKNEALTRITFKMDVFANDPIKHAYETIKSIENIESITIEQLYED